MENRKIALFFSFISALLVSNVSGPQYVFPTYGPSLANRFQWNSIENSMVSTAVFVGTSFSGPLSAWQVGNLGCKKTTILSAFVSLLGTLLLAETYNGYLSSNYILCSFYLVCIGAAGAASYMSVLESQTHNFKSYRGLRLGLTSASLGMSGLVFSQLNDKLFRSENDGNTFAFLLFYACTTALVTLFGSFVLGHLPDQRSLTLSKPIDYASTNNDFSISRTKYRRDPIDKISLLGSIRSAVPIEEESALRPPVFLDTVGVSLCLCLFVILGLSYVYLTNIGSILASLSVNEMNPSDAQHLRNLHISLFSVCNCIARVVFGISSDILQIKAGIHRLWFMWLAAFGFTITLFCLNTSVLNIDSLVIYTAVIAVIYGVVFGICPVLVSEIATKNFIKTWGWIMCAPAIGSQLLNILFGFAYDKELKRQKEEICHGTSCFTTFFSAGVFLAGFCTCAISLAIYKKGLYKSQLDIA